MRENANSNELQTSEMDEDANRVTCSELHVKFLKYDNLSSASKTHGKVT